MAEVARNIWGNIECRHLHGYRAKGDLRRADAVAYRLLEEDAALSAGDLTNGNMLIQGDNLDALKAQLPYYKGRVKCMYIGLRITCGQRSSIMMTIWSSSWPGNMCPAKLHAAHV